MAVPFLSSLMSPNEYQEVPDGGWGWLVAMAFFLVEVFTYGTIKCFGIFLQDLIDEFGESNSRVSWIISICVFVMTFTAPLSSVMTNRFGFQPVVILGGILISLGTITTGYTTSLNEMYITTGIVAGLGYCLTFLPTITILSQYFNRRRSMVIALASTGESFSMFAFAPAFTALKDTIGWRHTLVVIGALQSTVIICGALLRPIVIKPRSIEEAEVQLSPLKQTPSHGNSEDSPTIKLSDNQDNAQTKGHSLSSQDFVGQSLKEVERTEDRVLVVPEIETEMENSQGDDNLQRQAKQGRDEEKGRTNGHIIGDGDKPVTRLNCKLLDFSILRKGSFICYSLFGLFATLGFFAPPLYIIKLSVSRGVGRERSAYMLSIMAVAEVMGRFSVGWVMTRRRLRKKKLLVLQVCVILMTLVLVAFTLVREFYGLAACCAMYGFFMGTISCTHITLLAEEDVVGIERMSSAAGVYVFIHSFAGLAGPPLGGVLVDVTQNYGSAFYSCAAGMGLGALFLGLVRSAKKLPCRKRGKCPEERNEQMHEGSRKDNAELSAGQKPDRGRDALADYQGQGAEPQQSLDRATEVSEVKL